ncbi:MAG: N-acetylglucosamine-6-phosphate deacetylase [Sporichthyaceae bacterium]|nr:N-acetylglucosamine-6-phosphate deacetylase [Sporichthyaceae bacterium]
MSRPDPILTLTNANVLTAGGEFEPGWVRVEADQIVEIGQGAGPDTGRGAGPDTGQGAGPKTGQAGSPAGAAAGGKTVDCAGQWLVPGYLDMHVHGGGGGSFTTGDQDEARQVAQFHRRHGTTAMIASLVTAPIPELVKAIESLAELVEAGELAGLHLEGPYLSRARCGAHNPAYLRKPDLDEATQLLEAGRGTIKMITIAPELPGATELIRHCVAAGVVVAVGHTDATYNETRAALAAGARVATHLYNGMRGLHHREPGPPTALLHAPDVVVELINDGVHLHDAVIGLTFDAVGADRIALITDAMAAAGMGDGVYPLGPMSVRVTDGVARLLGPDGAIAGSTLTMDQAVRRAVDHAGVPKAATVIAASRTPARILGLADRFGSIAPGRQADLLLLDEKMKVCKVLAKGSWVPLGR